MNPYDPFDGLIRDAENMDRIVRETEFANQMSHDLGLQEEIARGFGGRADPAFESIMKDQEALSGMMNELTTPSLAFTFPEIAPVSPPEITSEDSMRWLNDLRIPVERLRLDFPEIHFPESRSLAELEQMPDSEIRALLDRDVSIKTVQIALRVLAMRHQERTTRPHWSVVGTFWSSVIFGVICAAIGAITVFLMLR